jgi:hypothetical protein
MNIPQLTAENSLALPAEAFRTLALGARLSSGVHLQAVACPPPCAHFCGICNWTNDPYACYQCSRSRCDSCWSE